MKIVLVEKTITRNAHERIENISKRTVGTFFGEYIPRSGEVICYSDGNYYEVLQVIHTVTSAKDISNRLADKVILEVKLYSNTRFHDGKYPHHEEITLVTQMSSTSWTPASIDKET